MTNADRALALVLRNMPATQVARIAHLAEQAGFTHIFFPENGHAAPGEIAGRDPFLLSSAALCATDRLRAGPGVAATVIRPYYSTAITAGTLQEASGGRFLLGCGVSHASAMSHRGEPYPTSPLAHARDYLEKLAATRSQLGYGADFPVYLSALGPKMLELAAARADGVMLNWMSLAAARDLAADFRTARATAPRADATIVLYLRIGSAESLRAEAEQYRRFDNYRRHFERQDLTSIDAVAAATCLATDPRRARDTVDAYRAAGVDVPAIYPVGLSAAQIEHLIDQLACG